MSDQFQTYEESLDCPRCGHGIPSDERRGEYPGALSRLDNVTYICSECGQREALFQYFHGGHRFSPGGTPLPPIDQPIPMGPFSWYQS